MNIVVARDEGAVQYQGTAKKTCQCQRGVLFESTSIPLLQTRTILICYTKCELAQVSRETVKFSLLSGGF